MFLDDDGVWVLFMIELSPAFVDAGELCSQTGISSVSSVPELMQ